MRLPRLKKGEIVLVIWRDASSSDGWQAPEAFLDRDTFVKVYSVGKVIGLPTKRHPDLSLAADWDGKANSVGRLMAIPQVVISEIKKLS